MQWSRRANKATRIQGRSKFALRSFGNEITPDEGGDKYKYF